MSQRRWRGRATAVVSSSDEEEEEEEEAPRRRQRQRGAQASGPAPVPAPAPRASRRGGLQLSQSTSAAGSGGSASNALAVLLAGSRAAAAANGATADGSGHSSAGGAGAAPTKPHYPRRGTRTVQQPSGTAIGTAVDSGTGSARQQLSAAAAAGAAIQGAPAQQAPRRSLWVERHAPTSEAELVVHKKKVQEVRQWLEAQRASLGQPGVWRLLVVSGPPGCGKSSVLNTLAKAVGFDVSEWRPPNPVQWEEAEYAGIQRRSKLDDFDEFVARTKMPHLSLRSSGSGASSSRAAAASTDTQATAAGAERRHGRLPPSLLPTLVMVDDLPHAAGPEQRKQIAEALADLAAGARFPVVVVATETSGKAQQEKGLSAAAGSFQGMHKDLVAVLEAHHATSISLNPFTPTNIAKALLAILEKERRALPQADVLAIAEQSNGDLFNAISTLQFVCTGVAVTPRASAAAARGRGRGTKRKTAARPGGGAAVAGGVEGQSQVGFALRDSTLTLFHALGKLLYNKRREDDSSSACTRSQQPGSGSLPSPSQQGEQQTASTQPAGGSSSGQRSSAAAGAGFWQAAAAGTAGAMPASSLQLAPWAKRQPMEFDPETVLAAAGLEAGSVAAFLHENLPHFIDDSAVQDAAASLDQLSAADCLASGRRWGTGDAIMGDDDSPSSTLLDALAASTAARGVCFSNAHPAPRRWLPLKAPTVFAAGKGLAANRAELSRRTAATWALAGGMASLEPAGRLAAELLPFARRIAACCPNPAALNRLQPARWSRFWNGQLYEQQGSSGGGSWQQEQQQQEEGGITGAAGGNGAEQLPADDVIEESEDEDDW